MSAILASTETATVFGALASVLFMIVCALAYGVCEAIANRRPNWRRIDARRARAASRNRRI